MRKILLLTVIGALGFSPQIFSALNLVSHSIVLEYLHSNNRVCMLSCSGDKQDGALLVADLGPVNICTKIILKTVTEPGLPATKVFSHQDLLFPADPLFAYYSVFIPRKIATVTTLHLNRMVNRKRILLSG